MDSFKLVDKAENRPGMCLASRDTEGPFIDTGCWTKEVNPYIYLSARYVEEVARKLLGMVPAKEVEERFAFVDAKAREQAERLEELERFQDAVAEYEDARDAVLARMRKEDSDAANDTGQ